MRMKDESGTILSKLTFHLFSVCQKRYARYDEKASWSYYHYRFCGWTMGNGGQANYAAAKAGLIGLVNHWRAKLRHAVLL